MARTDTGGLWARGELDSQNTNAPEDFIANGDLDALLYEKLKPERHENPLWRAEAPQLAPMAKRNKW